jgi:hypothetical protein
MRDARFDLPASAVGSLLAAALSVGLATAFLYLARADTGADVGPTAATLEEAFSTLLGAALGLFLGSGSTAAFARRGSRLAAGIFAGLVAYAAVLVPIIVLTGPSDVSAGESFSFALLLGIPLALSALIGSIAGAALRPSSRVTFGRRRARHATRQRM